MDTNTKIISKKLVNNPTECVTESLQGYVATHAHLKLLKGYNIVVRTDFQQVKKENKVVIITGGGSGHEPAHIGYVGKGMLTAAVCGDVFTSPSSASILTAIRTCASGAGVLLIVKNYTGDRLNFGKALEVSRGEGINIEMVIVDEDCALTSKDRSAGRRGLCGTVLVHKIAGSMAESGKSLHEIQQYLNDHVIPNMGTISLSLSACSIPGKPYNFHVPHDVVEFGLGIHGEAGIYKTKLLSAKELVKKMLDHMMENSLFPRIVDEEVIVLINNPDEEVIVLINNLSGTTNLELSIVAKEARQYLESLKVKVIRCFMGAMVTSLEMAGVSITIMVVKNKESIKFGIPMEKLTGIPQTIQRKVTQTG